MNIFHKKQKNSSNDASVAMDGANPTTAGGDLTDFNPAAIAKKKKRKKWPLILIVILLIAAIGTVVFLKTRAQKTQNAAANYTNYTVAKQDIVSSLSGSGSLQPADSYTVTTLVSGEVLSSNFSEGDVIAKNTILYQIDSSDVSTNLERAELSVSQSRKSYERKLENLENLKIKATSSGTVIELSVNVGDDVKAGQTIAKLRNSNVMQLTLPFNSSDAKTFTIGQAASVILDGSYEILNGSVSKISAVDQILSGNMLVRQVTIDVNNPGALSTSHSATAMIGEIACNAKGSFTYQSEAVISAALAGEVVALNAMEGDYVAKDQLLITLSSESLEDEIENAANTLKDAELALENQNDNLDSYIIKSPISGTIIDKTAKSGDKVSPNSSMCVIYDLSYLSLTLNIDELDIAKVSVGQTASITADAAEGHRYIGTITKVSINGTTASGVTTYPITIQITDTEGLLPGMNVEAEIVIESVKDVLAVPIGAVARGNRVLRQTDSVSTQENSNPAIPEGFAYVDVTVGLSNDDYVEITSGLSEGDIIAVTANETITTSVVTPFGTQQGGQIGGQTGGQTGGQGGIPQGGGTGTIPKTGG